MFGRLLAFRTRRQPYMIRLSYRYEMRSALTFPLAASLAEGSFTGVVAAKYFNSSPLLIAVITAAPMFGNIMAMVWSELAKTRAKVRLVNLAQLGVICMIAAAALTAYLPLAIGGWVFGGLIILARLLAAGITTIRSDIWRSNYPRQIRGQVVGRILIVATSVLAVATLAGAAWLDHNPRSFVYLYPCASLLGAIGIWQFSHIRIRHEGQYLRHVREREGAARDAGAMVKAPHPALSPEYRGEGESGHPKRGLRAFFLDAFTILREDKAFRDYQRYQFLSGASFMFFAPGLLYMVSREMTNPTTQYMLATFVLQIVPMLFTLIWTPLWAPLFDRTHILTFRVYQSATSVVGQALIFVGAMWGLRSIAVGLAIVGLGQVMIGISNAGSNLAWDLGHCDFASGEKATTYMGVHVMLTGLRGCIAPFLGAWLFQAPFIGRYVFLISTVACTTAFLGFYHMSRSVPRRRRVEAQGELAAAVA